MNLSAVRQIFEENFSLRGEIGAAVSVWRHGEEILSLAHGTQSKQGAEWTQKTLVPVYSATKALSAATLLLALDRQGLSANTKVTDIWTRFPVASATFADLLSHRCGLAALDRPADLFDHSAVVAAIEAQPPQNLASKHGYHPRTFGTLVEQPVRLLTGVSLGEYFRRELAQPLDLDFFIGLPASEHHRVATLYPGKAGQGSFDSGFYKAFSSPGSLTQRAFSSPQGLRSIQEMNQTRAWAAGFPALGGIGSASALAKFYQAAAGFIDSPLTPSVRSALATRLVQGSDQVLHQPTSFSAGCQLDPLDSAGRKLRRLYGASPQGFGHPGAGGSHAFVDPDTAISFAYTMNQMQLSVMPGPRAMLLIDALYS